MKRLTGENEAIKRQAELDKEKLHALEAAMEELQRRGENIVECIKPSGISGFKSHQRATFNMKVLFKSNNTINKTVEY